MNYRMKYSWGLIFSVLILWECSNGNSKSEVPIISDQSKPIIVSESNPIFKIIVQSNPSTGYSWFLKGYNPNLITPLKKAFYSPYSPTQSKDTKLLAGAPGYEEWSFKAKPESFMVPQLTSITLVYLRPWDEQSSQIVNFKVITQNVN